MTDPSELPELPDRPLDPDTRFQADSVAAGRSPEQSVGEDVVAPDTGPVGTRDLQRSRRRPVVVLSFVVALVAVAAVALVLRFGATTSSSGTSDAVAPGAPSSTGVSDGPEAAPSGLAPTGPQPTPSDPPGLLPGWTETEFGFTIREGSAYVLGGDVLFVWGGAPNGDGELPAGGLIIDLGTGESRPVEPAPFGGRYLPAVVWTGSEFLIVGGHDLEGSFADGGAFDPVSGSWSPLPAAPVFASQHPSAVWTGDSMFVWFPSRPARFAALPEPGPGQLVSYDPETTTWTRYPPPPVDVVDAVLVAHDESLLLVGGPLMRDVGTGGPDHRLVATTLDLRSGEWSDPVFGPRTEAARILTSGPTGGTAAITAEGEIWDLTRGWELSTTVDEDCWWAVAAAPGYVRVCDTYLIEGSSLTRITDDPGGTLAVNTYGSAFLAGPEGQLIIVRDTEAGTRPTGSIVVQTYDPHSQ